MHDVTLIGAGPAGSVAALILARRGWAVTLLEQHRFPRDKVCGECLSALGIEVLQRLGLGEAIANADGVSLNRAMIHGQDSPAVITPLPRPMLGLSRHRLDALLLDAARNAGAIVRQPMRCEGIDATAAGVIVRARDLETNVVETARAEFVILADGKGALQGSPPSATGDIGIKSHWVGVDGPRDAIELFGCGGCYGGLAAIEEGRWNAAFSVPAHRVRQHRGDIDALFAKLIGENGALGRRIATARRIIPWLASPLPRFGVRKGGLARVIPVGNAAAALEPIGGEGMGLALRSAELAAAALIASAESWSALDLQRLLHAYDKLWRLRRIACRAGAMVVSSTNAMDVASMMMQNNDRLVEFAMLAIGK